MSDIDNMNALVTGADAVPSTVSGVTNTWVTPATPVAFTVQIDPNSGFWTIYDGGAYVAQRGWGSVLLQAAMQQLRIAQ